MHRSSATNFGRFYTYWRSWWPILAHFMPTEDLGYQYLLIFCPLKILVTNSCLFCAYWRSWWLILADFMLTEDLGNQFLLILCLLKILATNSCWFYALCLPIGNKVRNIGALIFVWKPSMAVFAYSHQFSRSVSWSYLFGKQHIDDWILHCL